MAKKKKKSAKLNKSKEPSLARKLFSSLSVLKRTPLIALFLGLLWLPWSGHVWTIGQEGLWMPLNTDIFEALWSALGNYRIVLSHWLIYPSLFLFSYLGPLSLIALFYMFKISLPTDHTASKYLAFFLTCLFAKQAMPGEFPLLILEIIFILFLFLPFLREKPRPFQTWSVLSLAVLISALTKIYFFPIFWLSLCFIFSHLIHFVFISRLKMSYSEKKSWGFNLPYGLGLFALSFWVLATYYFTDWPVGTFSVSPYFWIGFIPSSLGILCAWLHPWKSILWLRVASFGLGSLLSSQMDLPLLVLTGWLLIFILQNFSGYFSKIQLPAFQVALKHWALILFVLGFSFFSFQIYNSQPERKLNPKWLQAINEIHKESPEGVLLYGNSLPFISTYYPGKIYQNANIELISSQTEFTDWMEEKGVNAIVADTDYLRKKWIQMIQDGFAPNKISRSILSRLTTSNGSAVETSTLRLPEITQLRSRKLKNKSLVWITFSNE